MNDKTVRQNSFNANSSNAFQMVGNSMTYAPQSMPYYPIPHNWDGKLQMPNAQVIPRYPMPVTDPTRQMRLGDVQAVMPSTSVNSNAMAYSHAIRYPDPQNMYMQQQVYLVPGQDMSLHQMPTSYNYQPRPYQTSYPIQVPANQTATPTSTPTAQLLQYAPKREEVSVSKPGRRLLTVINPMTRCTIDLPSSTVTEKDPTPSENNETLNPPEEERALSSASNEPEIDSNVTPDNVLTDDEPVVASDAESSNEEELADSNPQSSDDLEIESSARKRYSREFMYSLKNSEASKNSLKVFENIESIIRKKPRAYRGSERVINIPTAIVVKRVEGAFVPTKLRKNGEDGDKSKSLTLKLNITLNRLSDVNFVDTVDELRQLGINDSESLMLFADSLFQKSIRQAKYCKMFASLCKQFKGLVVQNSEPLEVLVVNKAKEMFNKPFAEHIAEVYKKLDAKIEKAKDEATKKSLEEDRETLVQKKTDAYYGNISFISELYMIQLITVKTMVGLIQKLKAFAPEESLASQLILFNSCGSLLEKDAKSLLDEFFLGLQKTAADKSTPSHLEYRISALIKLRKNKWISEKKGEYSAPEPQQRKSSVSHLPSEPKRKPMHTTVPVSPASLAVSQHTNETRKLGPSVSWISGSGAQKNRRNTQPVSRSDSRDASPQVAQPNAWKVPLAVAVASKNTKPVEAKVVESYDTVLKNMKPVANDFFENLITDPKICAELMNDRTTMQCSAILHMVLEKLMESKPDRRKAAGSVIAELLSNDVLKLQDFTTLFSPFFKICDEDWLIDFPNWWKLIAQAFEALINPDRVDWLKKLFLALQSLPSDGAAAKVTAQLLRLGSDRLSDDAVKSLAASAGLNWEALGVSGDELTQLLAKFDLDASYAVPVPAPAPNNKQQPVTDQVLPVDKLAELDAILSSSNNHRKLIAFMKNLSTESSLPDSLVNAVLQKLLQPCSKTDVGHRATALIPFVQDKGRQLAVLSVLNKCSDKGFIDNWINTLSRNRMLSQEVVFSFRKNSSDSAHLSELLGSKHFG